MGTRGSLVFFAALMTLTNLSGQSWQVPNWWLSSDPKKVLADPLFHTLLVTQRIQILSQIDPKFAKMPFAKQDAYLWSAETANLPKAPPPKQIFTWTPADPSCLADFSHDGMLTRRMEVSGLSVQATLERGGFVYGHLRVENRSEGAVLIRPQTFILRVVKPKADVLYFEYPMRVWWQTTKGVTRLFPTYVPTEQTTVRSADTGRTVATISTPDQEAKSEIKDMYGEIRKRGYEYAQTIIPNSLAESTLASGASVEGDVYFESSEKAREVILRAFIGEVAFDIPFTLPKK